MIYRITIILLKIGVYSAYHFAAVIIVIIIILQIIQIQLNRSLSS